ncbi:MAG: hypothetical protein HY270_20490, partial [Deltaproteobacteria bacterium]|nr:hypothetical protein [Deltaproteobacteria bacterium]
MNPQQASDVRRFLVLLFTAGTTLLAAASANGLTATPAAATPTPTPTVFVYCTPPLCPTGNVYYCPDLCPGGCGTRCGTPTPVPPLPAIEVTPSTASFGCFGVFDLVIRNSGAPGSTLEIGSLTFHHGYSQGFYGTGFQWDLSKVTLPVSLASGASLRIPITFSAS